MCGRTNDWPTYPNQTRPKISEPIKFLQNACDHMLTPQCSGPLFLTPRDVGRFGAQNLTTGWSARIMSNHKMKIQRAMHQLEMKFCRSGKSARQKRNHKSKINQQCISSIKNVSPRAKPTGSADNDPRRSERREDWTDRLPSKRFAYAHLISWRRIGRIGVRRNSIYIKVHFKI